jgi:D-serine deaminase-like pyridoxal phosphate-dependent protein
MSETNMMSQLSTPAVIVDLDIVERNISEMADLVKKAGIKHRPHIKTHKSVYFAQKQQEAGAVGITCAKIGEAEVMAEAGIDDILIAFPIIGEDKLERLYHLAQKVKLTCCVDSVEAAKALSDVGIRLSKKLPVYIEVDGGIQRCGRQPGADTLEFAQSINGFPGIEIIGILSYAGQIYGENVRERIEEIAAEEASTIYMTAELLQESGIPIQELSGGSSISSKFPDQLKGLTEVRAGNYIFHDRAQLSTGMVTVEQCALRIIVTVVSASAPGRAIIDAGSKTLTTDLVTFGNGYGYIIEQPEVEIYKLNEEHGYLRFDPSIQLRVGQRLTIIPNHSCVISNLCDEVIGVRGDKIIKAILIDARGKNK